MNLLKPKKFVYMYGCISRPHVNLLHLAMYSGMKLVVDITCLISNM